MLKKHKLCKVCKAIDNSGGKKLLNDIYQTKHFMKQSKTSLRQLAEDYKETNWFTYENLLTHVKKHQFMSEQDYKNRNLRQIVNKAEKQILKQQIEGADVWNQVIEMGMDALENGGMSIKAQDLLKAAKDKTDYQLKKQDQELKLAEMVFFFASGESDNKLTRPYDRRIIENQEATDFDAAAESTGHIGAGEDRPDSVHYPPSWDAAT